VTVLRLTVSAGLSTSVTDRRYNPIIQIQLREWRFAPKLLSVPVQNPVQSLNGGGAPRVPRWLRILVIGRNPKVTLIRAVILGALCVVGYKASVLHIRVDGISMLPTYQDGSKHFVNRLAYIWHEPQRGDVVGIRFSGGLTNVPTGIHLAANWLEQPHLILLKRIIGRPGETIAFLNGKVLIDGEVLDEPYEKLPCDWTLPPEKLGPNEYFVVGDNRSMPAENHTMGKARRDQILGKAIL